MVETTKKFEIKKWNAVALWAWDIHVDNCAICRNHIMDPCKYHLKLFCFLTPYLREKERFARIWRCSRALLL